jgi:hypothetical protein
MVTPDDPVERLARVEEAQRAMVEYTEFMQAHPPTDDNVPTGTTLFLTAVCKAYDVVQAYPETLGEILKHRTDKD